MRRLLLGLVLLVLVIPAPAGAIEEAVSDLVLIREGEVIEGDVLAGGNIVRVLGTIDGDLVAAAFEKVEIVGTVTGDVLAVAPTVVVEGEVKGSLRVLAGRTTVVGDVRGDGLVGSGSIAVDGAIEGDLYAAMWSGEISGSVGDRVKAFARSLDVGGMVGGAIVGEIRRVSIDDAASVGGDIVVVGQVTVDDAADVGGSVRTPAGQALPLRARSLVLLLAIVGLSIWMASGPVLRRIAPGWVDRHLSAGGLSSNALRGVAGFTIVGLAVTVVWLTAAASPSDMAVGLAVAGAVVAVVGFSLLSVAALVGAVPTTIRVGQKIGSPADLDGAHARGVVAVAVASLIPWVGPFVLTAFILAAIGGTLTRSRSATS